MGVADTGTPDADVDMGQSLIEVDAILDYVNPFVGTGGVGFAYGGMTPAAQTPLGMARLGPDTTDGGLHNPSIHHYSGYYFRDPDVIGFSHTHFVGTGAVDYGNLRVSPTTEARITDRTVRSIYEPMDKSRESAEPGYYTTYLTDPDVLVELTAADHVGLHRYTFGGAPHPIMFNMTSSIDEEGAQDATITVHPDGRLEGWLDYKGGYVGRALPFRLFVEGQITPAPDNVRVWTGFDAADLVQGNTGQSNILGVVLDWDSLAQPVEMKVAISMIDAATARAHFDQTGDFDTTRAQARDRWKEKLSRLRVAGGTDRERAILYTALYNTYRMPARFDEGGQYRGLDGEVHTADGFTYYSDLSLWDTYRTLHPWMTIYDPQVQRDSLNSLLAMARDGGYVPRWPAALSYTGGMVGTSADVLFGESAAKGVTGVDYEEAFDALIRSHDPPDGAPFGGRTAMAEYLEYGYLPHDISDESAAFTLEYAVHDAGVALLAETLGKAEDAATWRGHSQNWKNVWDADREFFIPRFTDGTFVEEFSPTRHYGREGYYTEGSAWQYLWHVLHDPEGLIEQLGGAEKAAERLEIFMEKSDLWDENKDRLVFPDSYYWHSNQPSLHVVYLFAAMGRLDRLAYWVKEVREHAYDDAPNGIVGNDDGGTLSSWYLFSALGFYPISSTTRYALSPPVFPRAVVTLEDGRTLEILADNPAEVGIDDVLIDGQAVGPYITHDVLMAAERIEFR